MITDAARVVAASIASRVTDVTDDDAPIESRMVRRRSCDAGCTDKPGAGCRLERVMALSIVFGDPAMPGI